MTSDLEQRLTSTLARAADEAPMPGADPFVAVRARQRRRRRRRAAVAAACSAAVAVVAVSVSAVTVLRETPPPPNPAVEYGFSPDKIPDFAKLPEPAAIWPEAVHKLPPTLPDGSTYAVGAVLGNGRYLVTRDLVGRAQESAPAIFDTGAGTVTAVGTSAMNEGFAPTLGVLMARVVDGQAVWFVEGSRNNAIGREIWAAPLDGGPARHLADLPDGSAPRFSVAGNAIIWDQQAGGTPDAPDNSVRTVPVAGGPVTDVPNSQQFDLVNIGPWIKNQHRGTGTDPRTAGELRNVLTGERRPWKASPDLQNVRCGPTWCTGDADGGHVGLQDLDGSNPVELPYQGTLNPTDNGRLAIGQLDLPTGEFQIIWNRTTGWSAAVKLPPRSNAFPTEPLSGGYSSDQDPEVLTLSSTKTELTILDLTAVK